MEPEKCNGCNVERPKNKKKIQDHYNNKVGADGMPLGESQKGNFRRHVLLFTFFILER